ncbi:MULTISPECIES: DMT family transporter [Terasakiella]|uniref:QacE family quaternary ammonium compound efflux SMR transporter n=1 Tax=Terasakiella brassicae TaxID=1634917 RepID=A0A917BS70_9PROT|nr:SMR family transporter [Terasakiella brassicae]GGF57005.1 QacE family quaternary ammonium compound efflux SMR transporter [Terasakiella brassicae]
MTYVYLAIAILAEVIGTSALKASQEFSRFWPSVIVVVGYGCAFYFMTLTLRVLPIGITYAIWSGIGVVLVTLSGIVFYKEIPDLPAILGIGLIVSGVILINGFSKSVGH